MNTANQTAPDAETNSNTPAGSGVDDRRLVRRFCWILENQRTGEQVKYWSKIPGRPVTAEHALTSPAVLAWAGGDKLRAIPSTNAESRDAVNEDQ